MNNSEVITAAKQLMDYIQDAKKLDKDLKELIDSLDNSPGLWEIRNLIKILYSRDIYACEGWNSVFGQASAILEFPNEYEKSIKKTKRNVGQGLLKINKENLSFYYKLGFIYAEVKNDIDNSNYYKELKGRHMDLIRDVNRLSSNLAREDNVIADKVKSDIYPEFITILGIFTAITFAIFGGMNLLTNLFKNMGRTSASLGQTLILAAIFGLIMWGITLLLFYWISTIKKDQTRTFYKNWGFWLNILFIVLIAVILIIGIILFTCQQTSVK